MTSKSLARQLAETGTPWKEVRTSPAPRTHETATIVAKSLNVPLIDDIRVGIEGNFVDLLPPTEPKDIIFVSHLPVLTQMLRTWSRAFGQEEPPFTEVSSGYLIDPVAKTIVGVRPSGARRD